MGRPFRASRAFTPRSHFMGTFTLPSQAAALQRVPAKELLAALQSRPMRDRLARVQPPSVTFGLAPGPASLVDSVAAAESAMDAQGALGLTVSFKEVIIDDSQEGFLAGSGEVYVITSILDGSGRRPSFKTQLFEGIRDHDHLPLGDGGMLVGMITDPRWFVDVHMIIMECDDDIRNVGKAIEKAQRDSGLSDILATVGGLATLDPSMITTVTSAVDVFLTVLKGILEANHDDHIATLHDFYLRGQGFGAGGHPTAGGLLRFQGAQARYEINLETLSP
jgi:hypothetical protein